MPKVVYTMVRQFQSTVTLATLQSKRLNQVAVTYTGSTLSEPSSFLPVIERGRKGIGTGGGGVLTPLHSCCAPKLAPMCVSK